MVSSNTFECGHTFLTVFFEFVPAVSQEAKIWCCFQIIHHPFFSWVCTEKKKKGRLLYLCCIITCADFKIRHLISEDFQQPRLQKINMDYIYIKKTKENNQSRKYLNFLLKYITWQETKQIISSMQKWNQNGNSTLWTCPLLWAEFHI